MSSESEREPLLEVELLGGVGEFGMNMMAVRSGDTCLLIDAGSMFPTPDLFGVDRIIPDTTRLRHDERRLSALVLTHAHEDHIGAVPYVWNLIDGPVYGTPLTLAFLKAKLDAHGLDPGNRLITVTPPYTVTVGELQVEFIHVTHSMPDCVALAIHSSVGTLIHTGDFKFDQTPPDGLRLDSDRLAELGTNGVLALMSDSTNAELPGRTGSELDVVPAFEEIFESTLGKIVVATFASSLHRIQILINLAARFERKIAFVGRGIIKNTEMAERLGYLQIPGGIRIPDADVTHHDPQNVLCIVTGSQGEALSALSRMAVDEHRHVSLSPNDVVVFSARAIPGNQRAIGRLMNHISRHGTRVVHEGTKLVHVSGHGSEEDLNLMLELVRPRYFVPIHGEYRYLTHHARIAKRVAADQTKVLLVENGDRLCFDATGAWVGERALTGRVLIDDSHTGEVTDEVIRDRRRLASDGIIVPVVIIDRQARSVEVQPNVITRGFVVDSTTELLLKAVPDMICELVDAINSEERNDHGLVTERVRIELQRLFRKKPGKGPVVAPVIMEV